MEIIILILLSIFLLACIFFYFGLLYSVFITKVPYVPSFNSELHLMGQQLNLRPGKTLVDLGCGDGKALRYLQKNFGLSRCDGFDINPMPIFLGKIYNFFQHSKNVNLYCKDFQKVDLENYDYVYLYLFPELLEKIENDIFSKIGKKTTIISNSFQFKKHKPVKILKNENGKSKIYIYTK